MNIGIVGLGNMRQGMADNLLEKGADLTVFTRTKTKMEAMAARGAGTASSAAELTRGCGIVLVCLPDVQTCSDIILGEIIPNAKAEQVIVDHSTVDVDTSRKCARAAAESGAAFLDAPMSGGSAGAANGTLAIMVGGERTAFDSALPYFEMMGTNIRHMGPTGTGTAMKLINQLLVSVHTVAAAEAFALANAAGVDILAAEELLAVSWGGSTMASRNAPVTASRDFPDSVAPVRNQYKDITIVKDLAQAEGLALELAITSQRMFHDMMNQGKQGYDIAAVIELIEQRSASALDSPDIHQE